METTTATRKRRQSKVSQTSRVSQLSRATKTSSQKDLQTLLRTEAFRILAPYKTFGVEEAATESEILDYYVQKKPLVLLADWSDHLDNSKNLEDLLRNSSQILKDVTKATGVNLYTVDRSENRLFYAGPKTSFNHRNNRMSWVIKGNTVVAAYVAHSLQYIIADQVLGDPRFPDGISYQPLAGPVICCPVLISENECHFVIELYRKIREPTFKVSDLEFVVMFTSWMSVTIRENFERLKVEKQRELQDYLLNLNRCSFADPTLFQQTIRETVNVARDTLSAERGSFLILDKNVIGSEFTAKLFDSVDELFGHRLKPGYTVKLHKKGMVRYVARTGKSLNLKDATKVARFSTELTPGPIMRSVLCMPVECNGKTVGVIQVRNKTNGGCFTAMDESLFKTFSMHCSLAVHYSRHHKEMKRNEYYAVSYEKLLRQLHPCCHRYLQLCEEPFGKMPENFHSIGWHLPLQYEKSQATKYVLYMFVKLMGSYSIRIESTIKFIMLVQKSYSNQPFHNFEHACYFVHKIFIMLYRNSEKFTNFEKKGLLIGGLCHDIDNSGFSNQFLKLVEADAAILYKDSCQQNYYYFITLQLLKTTQMFRNLTAKGFEKLCTEIKKVLLWTDWWEYDKTLTIIKKQLSDGFYWSNAIHRNHLKALMIHAAEWHIWSPDPVYRVHFREFFREGLHEAELHQKMGRTPIFPLDKGITPIEEIRMTELKLIPCLKLIMTVLPNTSDFFHKAVAVLQNRRFEINLSDLKLWINEE